MNALRQPLHRLLDSSSSSLAGLQRCPLSHRQYIRPQLVASRSQRPFSSSLRSQNNAPSRSQSGVSSATQNEVTLKTEEPQLSLTFTCTVTACGTRSSHMFTRRSYERGIIIVQCPGCNNRHLIADHLGWFKESTEDGKAKTVEDLMHAKGEKVTRGALNPDGVVEYSPE